MNQVKSEARSEVIGKVATEPQLGKTSRGVRVCRFQVMTESGPASNPVVKDIFVIGRLGAGQGEDLPVRCAALEVGEPVVVPGIERQRRRKTRGVNWIESAIEANEVRGWDTEPESEATSQKLASDDDPVLVVHCMRDDYDVYIGRGKDPHTHEWGQWGNRFSHRESESATVTRVSSVEEAIERYRRDLWRRLDDGGLSYETLAALKGKRLGCWCAPGPCHGEVLVAAAEWAAGRVAAAKVEAG
ncbi:MAG: 20 Ab1 orf 83 [Solirubrobacterales bacterium]|nr:20 Ab1 orf 83 [Solirubrobacterales bacterium]